MVENQILVQQPASSNPHKEFLVNYGKIWYPTKKNLYSITIIIFVEKGQLAPASMMVFDIKNLDRKNFLATVDQLVCPVPGTPNLFVGNGAVYLRVGAEVWKFSHLCKKIFFCNAAGWSCPQLVEFF